MISAWLLNTCGSNQRLLSQREAPSSSASPVVDDKISYQQLDLLNNIAGRSGNQALNWLQTTGYLIRVEGSILAVMPQAFHWSLQRTTIRVGTGEDQAPLSITDVGICTTDAPSGLLPSPDLRYIDVLPRQESCRVCYRLTLSSGHL